MSNLNIRMSSRTAIALPNENLTEAQIKPTIRHWLRADGSVSEAMALDRFLVNPSSGFTRPANATAYTAGDLVANNTTAGSVVPLQFSVARMAAGSALLRRVRIRKSTTSTANASFRLHLFSTPPAVTNGDNGAFAPTTSADWIGAMDATSMVNLGNGAAGNGVPTGVTDLFTVLASGQIVYGLIEALAAYTPGSGEVFTVTLDVEQQ